MKVDLEKGVIELSRRNLETLLAKLDDPASVRTIIKSGVAIVAVEDEEHYSDSNPPGMVYMPTSGKVIW